MLTSFFCSLATSQFANAQSQWSTSADFLFVPGFSSGGLGLGTNGVGNIVAVGYGGTDASGTTVAVTRESSDLGQSWQTSSVVTYPGTTALNFRAIANNNQTLYAAVGAFSSGGSTTWVVAQSADGGSTWGISDSFQLAPNQRAVVSALAVDGSGNVFAGGYATTDNQQYFIIRKLAHGTSQWSTVYQELGGIGSGFAIHPTAGIFAVGFLPYGTQSTWAVLQSPDDGNTWNVVDRYPAASGLSSQGLGIGVDSQGNLYATGSAGSAWVTRRSLNGGMTWTTTDTFYYTSTSHGKRTAGNPSAGCSVSFDYRGNVYVAGQADVSLQGLRWLVRELPTNESSWVISDDFQLTPAQSAFPTGYQAGSLSANSGHLLLVTGRATDATGVGHWITRRLVVP